MKTGLYAFLQPILDEIIDTPLPHQQTLLLLIRREPANRQGELFTLLTRLQQCCEAHRDATSLARKLAVKLSDEADGTYLVGLALLLADEFSAAHAQFTSATQQKPAWVLPWLGWAETNFQQQAWNELRKQHPHLNGVELSPYGAGDEETFLQLDELAREALIEQFQAATKSLGNYYTIAEMELSKTQLQATQQAWKDAA
jgi:hypothetical protein